MQENRMSINEIKSELLNVFDGISVTMTILYSFAGDFFSYIISDEGLQKVGLILTVVYLFFRCIYWGKKALFGKPGDEE